MTTYTGNSVFRPRAWLPPIGVFTGDLRVLVFCCEIMPDASLRLEPGTPPLWHWRGFVNDFSRIGILCKNRTLFVFWFRLHVVPGVTPAFFALTMGIRGAC